jgi:integrase
MSSSNWRSGTPIENFLLTASTTTPSGRSRGSRQIVWQSVAVARGSPWTARHVLAAGVPIIRLHDLRHTHATLALAAGVHPKVVQERLGHANIAITLDTYSHGVPALEEQAAHTVAALVFGQ